MLRKTAMTSLGLLVAAHAVAANATSGTYNYQGNALSCATASYQYCTYTSRQGLTASFTFTPDFIQGNGDQTVGISAVSAWSVFDGVQTLSSANGDLLRFDSTFTFNNTTLRTWNWGAVGGRTGQVVIYSDAPHYQDEGDGYYSHGNGTWTRGGGDATSAVPETATWAMMIAGFGLVGGAMRRRTIKVAFV